MADALSDLGPEAARRLAALVELPVAISDGRGRAVARTGPESSFCPLLVWEGERAAPLLPRCEACPRVAALLACEYDRIPRCPHGADAVRPILVGGAVAGWLATAVVSPALFPEVERAGRALDAALLPLGAAIAAERRERTARQLVAQKLLVARIRAERALLRLSPKHKAHREVELLRAAIDEACDVFDALRAAPGPAAGAGLDPSGPAAGAREAKRGHSA